jgi:hypothetical protein
VGFSSWVTPSAYVNSRRNLHLPLAGQREGVETNARPFFETCGWNVSAVRRSTVCPSGGPPGCGGMSVIAFLPSNLVCVTKRAPVLRSVARFASPSPV